jgi:transglutaminase-like putative cysteine protease
LPYLQFRMKLLMTRLPALIFLLLSAALFSYAGKPTISAEPGWIVKNAIDYANTALDAEATDGYIDINLEIQVSLANNCEYFRRSKKVISETGVQNASQVSISFDPSYEQLSYHSIRIIRNGQSLNRLQLSKVRTIQQEEELSSFIYNGAVDALLILDDVRKGDIIEYSYSITGFNPIFKNKYTREFSTEFSSPVYEIHYALLVPEGRKINTRNINESTVPRVSSAGRSQRYEWNKQNIRPLVVQDYIPSWYDPYGKILVSEYDDWKQVNDWALSLYPNQTVLSPALTGKISEIVKQHQTPQERTKAALRFVQDDIRYMGIEPGEHSHKPADPSKVFAQRFGDCKEKSYLLCCMLRAMNIEAQPVLINTVTRKELGSQLPAPTSFDHVTVRAKVGERYYWFDPTISYQRGDLASLSYPDYQCGLVISDTSTALTYIPYHTTGYQHVKESFKVAAMHGGGSLLVTTKYGGTEADALRSEFNSKSISELMASYRKFYATYYADIRADSLSFSDNDSTGVFTTKEYYTILKFWTTGKEKGSRFPISAFIINAVLKRPKDKDRKMPFNLSLPTKYREEITIDLPDNWRVTESETHLKNSCFNFNARFYCLFNKVHLDTDYETFKDFASTEEAPVYFNDLDIHDEASSFEISSGAGEPSQNGSPPAARNMVFAVMLLGVFVGGIVWWGRRK